MKDSTEFMGYSPAIRDFFSGLTQNNSKVWFDQNRKFYEKEIKDKSKEFINFMANEFMNHEQPYHADPKLSLFRINRDIRFSANKDPYKTNMGIFFPYSENPSILSKEFSKGIYIHYEVGNSFIAAGMYSPDSATLKKIRFAIADDYELFIELVNDKSLRKHFPDIFSHQKPLTRLTGFPQDHPAAEYLKQKDFSFGAKIPDDTFFNSKLPEFVIEKAEAGRKYLQFLFKAIY